jgi:hypothetical protein
MPSSAPSERRRNENEEQPQMGAKGVAQNENPAENPA